MAVTAQQLAAARRSSASTFDATCRIQRVTRTRDAQSGRQESVTETAPIPCRVGQMSQPRESAYAQQLKGRSGLVVTLATDVEVEGERIRPSDRLTLEDGRELEILGINGPHSLQVEQRIYCTETR